MTAPLARSDRSEPPARLLQSRLTGITWPSMPSERGASLLALLSQLDESQWWSSERLLAHQLSQLDALLQHAYQTVPFHRERLHAAGWRPGRRLSLAEFRTLPLLTRREVQSAGPLLHSWKLPGQFGGSFVTHTSGSSGEPVALLATELDRLLWEAITLRDHDWHRRACPPAA